MGSGNFAKECHIPGLRSHPNAEVVAICGRDYARTRAVACEMGIADVHTDHRELCARNDLDGITIATPDMYHAEHALAAVENQKHVFCEKPLALTVTDAQAMVRAAELSGKVHQVGFTFRYLHGVQELKRRIVQGDIGQPYYARIQYDNWAGLSADWRAGWREMRGGGGILYDLGSHLFDALRFVFGPFKAITGFLHNVPRKRMNQGGQLVDVEANDMASASFVHRNGVRGQWFVSNVTPRFAANGYLEVIGPEGALRASLSRGSVDSLQMSRPADEDWKYLPLPSEASDKKPHCLNRMMRGFVDACMRTRIDELTAATFYDGLAVQEAIEAVVEADRRRIWAEDCFMAW